MLLQLASFDSIDTFGPRNLFAVLHKRSQNKLLNTHASKTIGGTESAVSFTQANLIL